ncbi:velvet factor-domain-containing protein [Geranomyces variabilis]|nr:velvet factor-domain-containing protein [Geranomyces variabilis]KAJ3140013.1 hypothetical protein HDU90_008917 [Geranomyces variabilis]
MASGKASRKDDSPYSFVPHTQYARAPKSRRGQSLQQLCISIKQHPERARAFSGGVNEKTGDRRPLDPPPVVQLTLLNKRTGKTSNDVLHNPFYLCYASLRHPDRDEDVVRASEDDGRPVLMGQLVTSMARLKDTDNVDGAFFPFCNLIVTLEGRFRIMFTVFEIAGGVVHCRGRASTNVFLVYGKAFPGVGESTPLCRMFAEQGVRLRVRKEPKLRRNKPVKRKLDPEPNCDMTKRPMKRRSFTDGNAAPADDVVACVANFSASAKLTNEAFLNRRASNAGTRPVEHMISTVGHYGYDSATSDGHAAAAGSLPLPSDQTLPWGSISRSSPFLNSVTPRAPMSLTMEFEPPTPASTMTDPSRSPSAIRSALGGQVGRRGSDDSSATCSNTGTPSSSRAGRPTRISIDSLISTDDSVPGKQVGSSGGSSGGKTGSPAERPEPPVLPPPRTAQVEWDSMRHHGRRLASMPSPLAGGGHHAGRAAAHGPIASVALSKLDDAWRGSAIPSASPFNMAVLDGNSLPWGGHLGSHAAHHAQQQHHSRVYGHGHQLQHQPDYGFPQVSQQPPQFPPPAPSISAAAAAAAAPALAASKLYSHLYITQQPGHDATEAPQQSQQQALA